MKYVINCSVLPIKHKYYEEEVFAFIVVSKKIKKNIKAAKNILREMNIFLGYFKLPCYIKFLDALPLTSSQKPNRSELKELIQYVSKALVDMPEEVTVNEIVGEQTTVVELKVDKSDLGKVIGKQGRTARALRTILNAASTKLKKRSVLEIIE